MKKMRQIFYISLFSTLILSGLLSAGSLTPTTLSPDTTYVTLGDLYSKIGDSTYSTSSRSFDPAGTPAGTGYTLSQVYNLIQTPSADTIISGKTVRGVSGTYDISNLTPDKVRSGITYGTSSVGTWVSLPDYVVTGNGGPVSPNGNYFENGTYNGFPVYVGPAPTNNFQIYWNMGSWAISDYPVVNIMGFWGPSPDILGLYGGTFNYTGTAVVATP